MTSSKHDPDHAGDAELADDLERNPGIGQSKGAFATGEKPETAEGDNTAQGDVETDAGPLGEAVDPDRLGRTNS